MVCPGGIDLGKLLSVYERCDIVSIHIVIIIVSFISVTVMLVGIQHTFQRQSREFSTAVAMSSSSRLLLSSPLFFSLGTLGILIVEDRP
jgi:nitrate reductase gamma subunit